MSTRYRVALLGFGPFECRALEDYFRHRHDQDPSFAPGAAHDEADLFVVHGDSASSVEAVRLAGRMDRAVFIGAEPPAGAVVHLGRPIHPRQVLRALETLLLATPGMVDADTPITASAVLDALSPEGPSSKPSGRRITAAVVHFPFDVLVLEGRHTATSPLIAQLDRVGCHVSIAGDGGEATQLIAQSPVRVVFCDTQLREVDGLALCQQIKAVKKGAPSVVLMAPTISSTDKVRARLAGADALLAKPIPADDLLDVLRTVGDRRRLAR